MRFILFPVVLVSLSQGGWNDKLYCANVMTVTNDRDLGMFCTPYPPSGDPGLESQITGNGPVTCPTYSKEHIPNIPGGWSLRTDIWTGSSTGGFKISNPQEYSRSSDDAVEIKNPLWISMCAAFGEILLNNAGSTPLMSTNNACKPVVRGSYGQVYKCEGAGYEYSLNFVGNRCSYLVEIEPRKLLDTICIEPKQWQAGSPTDVPEPRMFLQKVNDMEFLKIECEGILYMEPAQGRNLSGLVKPRNKGKWTEMTGGWAGEQSRKNGKSEYALVANGNTETFFKFKKLEAKKLCSYLVQLKNGLSN
jgi:hypothetical protein